MICNNCKENSDKFLLCVKCEADLTAFKSTYGQNSKQTQGPTKSEQRRIKVMRRDNQE